MKDNLSNELIVFKLRSVDWVQITYRGNEIRKQTYQKRRPLERWPVVEANDEGLTLQTSILQSFCSDKFSSVTFPNELAPKVL